MHFDEFELGVGDTGIFQRDQTLNVLYCIVLIPKKFDSLVKRIL